jgi:hypothetical protein
LTALSRLLLTTLSGLLLRLSWILLATLAWLLSRLSGLLLATLLSALATLLPLVLLVHRMTPLRDRHAHCGSRGVFRAEGQHLGCEEGRNKKQTYQPTRCFCTCSYGR